MATIGYLRIVAEAVTDKLGKGLDGAATKVAGFGAKARTMALNTMAEGQRAAFVFNKFGAAAGAVALKTAAIGAAGSAAAVGGLAAFAKSGMDSINATRVLAERLGTSTEGLSKLQYAASIADVDSETLAGSLEKMQVRLGQVATTGKGKAADALQRFGLSAETLAKGDAIDSFHSIVGALGQIQSPAERAAAAVDLFGKSGAGMLNFVVQGSEGLADLESEADLLGLAITDIDAAKVDEADDSMTKVWETLGGLANRLAVEVAPYITAAAEAIVGFAKSGVAGGDLISQAMGWVVSGVGLVADVLQIGQAAWDGFKAAALMGISKVLEGIGWLADKLNAFAEFLGAGKIVDTSGIQEWAASASDASVEVYNQMERVWAKPWAHEAIKAGAAEIELDAEVRAMGAVEKAKEFRGGADKIGGDDEDKAKKFAGAFEVGSKEAYSALLEARGMGKNDKSVQQTATNTERTATAAESFNQKLDDLANTLSMGLANGGDLIDFLQSGA